MKRIELEFSLETKDYWRYYLGYYFSFNTVFYFCLSFNAFGICVAYLLLGGELKIQNFALIGAASALFVCLFNLEMSHFGVKNAKIGDGKCKYIFSDEKVEVITE